jgi:hypothetical protein
LAFLGFSRSTVSRIRSSSRHAASRSPIAGLGAVPEPGSGPVQRRVGASRPGSPPRSVTSVRLRGTQHTRLRSDLHGFHRLHLPRTAPAAGSEPWRPHTSSTFSWGGTQAHLDRRSKTC